MFEEIDALYSEVTLPKTTSMPKAGSLRDEVLRKLLVLSQQYLVASHEPENVHCEPQNFGLQITSFYY